MKNFHWYYRNGKPCYELIKKDGSKKVPTIIDARKLDLVPSVTTILQIIKSFGLTYWQNLQICKAAWDEPKNGDYDLWQARVLEKSEELSLTAADRGSAIHEAIEAFLATTTISGEFADWQRTFADWWINQEWFGKEGIGLKSEDYIPAIYGYGGRYDILIGDLLIDIKTQDTKGKPIRYYRSWGRQLMAYSQALGGTRIMNVVLDSYNPKIIEAKEWPEEDKPVLLDEFNAAQKLWLSENPLNNLKNERTKL